MISASIVAANMWKNSLKNVKSVNNKTVYEILLSIFLQRNGAYFLNKPRMYLIDPCNSSVKYHLNTL